MATINDLAVATLVAIFDYFPLLQLVHIDEVCRKWREQKSYALSKRKQLIICENDKQLHWFKTYTDMNLLSVYLINKNDSMIVTLKNRQAQHALYAKRIPSKMLDNIIKLMPNLTVIRIMQKGSFNDLLKIKLLLHHYRSQLVEVNIDFVGTFNAAQDNLETSKIGFHDMILSLITTLNSLEKLDILELWLQIPRNCESSIDVDLSVARRVKVLRMLIDSPRVDLLAHTYQTYARENEDLQQLGSSNRFNLDTLLTFGPRVLTAMREVDVNNWIDTEEYDDFKQFARLCPNLEMLTIGIDNLSMAQVAEALLPCRSLLFLEVNFDVDDDGHSTLAANGLPLDQLPVLSSVKYLLLYITTNSHRDIEQMNLEVIFPYVKVVKLVQAVNRCQVCNFTIPPNIAESSRSVQTAYSVLVHECQRLTRPYFARFSQLAKLIANIGQKEIPSSFKNEVDFTPETLGQETYSASGELSAPQREP